MYMDANRTMPDLTPGRTILKPEQIDDVAQAVLAVARELWVTIDRQLVLESVLAKHGLDVSTEIDALEPDPVLQAKLDARRAALLDTITQALNGKLA
jgi:hypothetical protein